MEAVGMEGSREVGRAVKKAIPCGGGDISSGHVFTWDVGIEIENARRQSQSARQQDRVPSS